LPIFPEVFGISFYPGIEPDIKRLIIGSQSATIYLGDVSLLRRASSYSGVTPLIVAKIVQHSRRTMEAFQSSSRHVGYKCSILCYDYIYKFRPSVDDLKFSSDFLGMFVSEEQKKHT
jgi:hypothetical protein